MKKIILLISVLIAFNANSSEKYSPEKLEQFEDYCSGKALTAQQIYVFRKEGRAMSDMLKMIKGKLNEKDLRESVFLVYGLERSEIMKRMSSDFKDEMHLKCLKRGLEPTIKHAKEMIKEFNEKEMIKNKYGTAL